MTSQLPWADIKRPAAGYNARLASADTVVPVSWGKDTQSQNVLIIELDGDYAREFKRLDLSVRGMAVDLRLIDRVQVIVITLEEHVNADLFYSFCRSVIAALELAEDSSNAFSITSSQIMRWRTFLSGKRSSKLSDGEVRGLFAELWILRKILTFTGNPSEAVSAWCGPDKVHQDFQLRDLAIETKAISGRERNSVRITSEDQLEALSDRLYLAVIRLVTAPEHGPHALSLNELVRIVEGEITDPAALNEFGRKISSIGYFELPDYDEPAFIVADMQFYRVEEGFPRLVRSAIPAGLARLNYDIQLEVIEGNKCDETEVWT